VLSQADILIAMKLTASQDRDAIGAWIEGQADRQEGKRILGDLPRLQPGDGYLWAPGHSAVTRPSVRRVLACANCRTVRIAGNSTRLRMPHRRLSAPPPLPKWRAFQCRAQGAAGRPIRCREGILWRKSAAVRYRRPSVSISPLLRNTATPEFQWPPLGFLPRLAASSSASDGAGGTLAAQGERYMATDRANEPEMDLFAPNALRFGGVSGIWTRIWVYTLWPDDEKQRNAYVLSMYAAALAAIERHADTDQDYARAGDIVYGNFRELGGCIALVPRWNSGIDLKRAAKTLRTAAAVLDIIKKTPCSTGSLNKSVHVIDKTGITYSLVRGRTGVLNAWKTHKVVAHLRMPTERIAMRQMRDVLRLRTAGVGPNEIARRVGVAPSTVRLTSKQLADARFSWPLPAKMTDSALEAALFAGSAPSRAGCDPPRAQAQARHPGDPVGRAYRALS
jgi:hypothetical protein